MRYHDHVTQTMAKALSAAEEEAMSSELIAKLLSQDAATHPDYYDDYDYKPNTIKSQVSDESDVEIDWDDEEDDYDIKPRRKARSIMPASKRQRSSLTNLKE